MECKHYHCCHKHSGNKMIAAQLTSILFDCNSQLKDDGTGHKFAPATRESVLDTYHYFLNKLNEDD